MSADEAENAVAWPTGRRYRVTVRRAVFNAQLLDHRTETPRAATPYVIHVGTERYHGITGPDGTLFQEGVLIGWFKLEAQGEMALIESFYGTRNDPPSLVWLDAERSDPIDLDPPQPPPA